MTWIYRYFTGSFRITFHSPKPERILRFTLNQNVPVWNIKRGYGFLEFSLTPWNLKALRPFLDRIGTDESWSQRNEGILRLFSRFRKRPGICVGAFLFAISLILSQFFIWSVEVEGNVLIPEEELHRQLAQMGLKEGKPISSVDPSTFSLSFQVKHPELSFASLNVIGTRAILSVREREVYGEKEETSGGVANLTAGISGEIVRYEVLSGKIAVKSGDVVPKGALLVSGVVEKANGAFSLVEASGRVFAKTQRYFEVTVPFLETGESFSKEEETKRKYEILGITFSHPSYETSKFSRYRVTENAEWIRFFGRTFPIRSYTRVYYEIEEKNRAVTVDTAKNLAYDKYEEYKRDTLLPGYQILEENAQITQNEESLTLSVEMSLEENIARKTPFSYLP